MRATSSASVKGEKVLEITQNEKIETVATELFIRDGYNGVSYLGIGKELGITHSNIHYYYRTKGALAEAVLKRVSKETLRVTGEIWTDTNISLFEKFVRIRNSTFESYLHFNPDGKGGRPWGLLSRFSMEADALTPEMRRLIRSTLRKMEENTTVSVEMAIASGELQKSTPVEGVTLQISSMMYMTGQLTRHASGFSRLDDLFKWTISLLLKAYGDPRAAEQQWPALPLVRKTAQAKIAA